jgi:hypothetical protein
MGARRRAVFEISVSNDGRQWRKATGVHAAAEPAPAQDRVDIFQAAGGANRVVTRRYPVSVAIGGEVKVTLTPRVGKAILSTAVLEPSIDPPKHRS